MKQHIITLACVLIAGLGIGQNSNYIPPSPNAAALVKSVDVQVGEYTGVPNISLPLYTVKSGDLTLPITLDYHASGIKVEQEASWVGLGWSLNAGGCITRQTRGKDDFGSNGYVFSDSLPPSYSDNYPKWGTAQENMNYIDFYKSVSAGNDDGEPDLFYYNFNGKSGKLIFEKQSGLIAVATPLSQNGIKFLYNCSGRSWEVTDENGVKYTFSSTEWTTNYFNSSTTRWTSSTCYNTSIDNEAEITTWYLNKIEPPTGNPISFEYADNQNETITQVQRSELFHQPCAPNSEVGISYQGSGSNNYTASMQETDQIFLQKITFADGYIDFISGDRTDLASSNSNKPQRLERIEIYDKTGELKKKYTFNYSYFNDEKNTTEYERLKLNSIVEASNTDSIPPYEFTYNAVSLPSKVSSSQDYWGFYNGKYNASIKQYQLVATSEYVIHRQYKPSSIETLLPYFEGKVSGLDCFLNGANREPDSLKMQAAILTKIKYPTGGTTEFEYEPNQYQLDQSSNTKDTTVYASSISSGSNPVERTFSLDQSTYVKLDYVFYDHNQTEFPEETGIPEQRYTNGIAELRNAGSTIMEFRPMVNSFETYIAVCLPAGQYTLYVSAPEGVLDIFLNASYKKKIPKTKNIGGGLRVHRIVNKNESQTITNIETYAYDNAGVSTGRLMTPLVYYYTGPTTMFSASTTLEATSPAVVQTSYSCIPLGNSAQGNPIGYDEVIKSQVSATGASNGKTLSYFKNTPESEYSVDYFLPNIPNLVHNDNGFLSKQEVYDKENNLVSRKTFDYTLESTTSKNVKGVKIYRFTFDVGAVTDYYAVRFYDNNLEWWYMSADITDTYLPGGSNNYVRAVNNYFYDNSNHKLLTRKNTLRSDNISVETKTKYPSDINAGIYASMYTLNMLNYPIEETTLVNNNITSSKLTTYKTNDSSYVPDKVYLFETATPLAASSFTAFDGTTKDSHYGSAPELGYDDYNTNGTIRQLTGRDGITTAYLWDATGNYPMAQVKGATWQQVSGYNGLTATTESSTLFSNLKGQVGTGPFITTFTYKPLVGITSQTDPNGVTTYYEYDSFGRLKISKDDDGNIIKMYKYHYQSN